MKINSFDIGHYSLPLVQPLTLKGRAVRAREGFLVRLMDADGRAGWGDVAPLPGFSGEGLADAHEAMIAAVPRVAGFEIADAAEPFSPEMTADWPPSVRAGMEQAAFDLIARERGVAMGRMWSDAPAATVPVNGLIAGADDVSSEIARVKAAGCTAVKLKVGRGAVEEDAERVRRVAAAAGSALEIRLDANRAWTLDDAKRFAAAISGVAVAYIEEPLSQSARLSEFAEATGLPIALDETLLDTPMTVWIAYSGVTAVVLKPTLLGGYGKAARIARRAAAAGMRCIVSSSFESGVGLFGLAHLASAVGGGAAAGLDTYRWLRGDLLEPRLRLDRSPLDIGALSWEHFRVNEELLSDARHGNG